MRPVGRVTGLVLDAGALLAVERGNVRVRGLLLRAAQLGLPIDVPAGVLAQAWRDGSRQARIARLLGDTGVSVVPLDETEARAVGVLCGRSGHADVVDVSVVLHAVRRRRPVVTSDPGDLRRVSVNVELIPI